MTEVLPLGLEACVSGWNKTRCGGACRNPLVALPPEPGASSLAFLSLAGVPSSPEASALSFPVSLRPDGRKVSSVRVSNPPPLAVKSSSISLGGGSFPWTVDISKAARYL